MKEQLKPFLVVEEEMMGQFVDDDRVDDMGVVGHERQGIGDLMGLPGIGPEPGAHLSYTHLVRFIDIEDGFVLPGGLEDIGIEGLFLLGLDLRGQWIVIKLPEKIVALPITRRRPRSVEEADEARSEFVHRFLDGGQRSPIGSRDLE